MLLSLIIEPILVILKNQIPLKPALKGGGGGSVCSLANYSVAYEETESNRVSDFRDFVCSLFPKAILFYFYYSTVAGVVPYGGRKKSPRISS